MISAEELFRSLRDVTEFTVTEDHLRLLRQAWVDSWDAGEGYGAPRINPKKPYGNSYVQRDIGHILQAPDRDWEWENGENTDFLTSEAEDRFTRLHVETGVALQIVLATGEFRPGRYTRSAEWAIDWTRQQA